MSEPGGQQAALAFSPGCGDGVTDMRTLVLVLAAVLLLAGCGGGDDAQSGSEPAERTPTAAAPDATPKPRPKPPTHAEFVRALDRTCKRAYRRSAREFREKIDARDFDGAATVGREVQRRAAQLQRRRRELDVPRRDRREFRRYLRAEDDHLAATRQMNAALRDRSPFEVLGGLGELRQARDRRADAASDLGIKNCGD
jgi:hypothetical protein